jgi:hypothetical protein
MSIRMACLTLASWCAERPSHLGISSSVTPALASLLHLDISIRDHLEIAMGRLRRASWTPSAIQWAA